MERFAEKLLIIVFMITILIVGTNKIVKNASQRTSYIKDSETVRLDQLRTTLSISDYFKNSEFEYDLEKLKMTIDHKYDVYIKNGYYLMNVKNILDEEKYCQIVDAINQSLGALKEESLETCKMSLDGIINYGNINVEFNNTYKVLTVNTNDTPSSYSVNKEYSSDELISISELNYNIVVHDYIFTSLSIKYDEETKELNICGNVFNKKQDLGLLNVTVYNDEKEVIEQSELQYNNDTKKYIPFCQTFKQDKNIIKYYSIGIVQ